MKIITNKKHEYKELVFIDKDRKERLAIGYLYIPKSYEIGFNISFYTHLWIGISLSIITVFVHFNSKEDRSDLYEDL